MKIKQVLHNLLRISLYTLAGLCVIAISFASAERGMESLLGTNRLHPPSRETQQVSFAEKPVIRGKVEQQASLPTGKRISRTLDVSHSKVADSIDQVSIRIGIGLENTTRQLLQTLSGKKG